MGIRVTSRGMQTTVQDKGRTGFQRYGFSVSGAMDQIAFKLANSLVGNDPDEAVLEMALMGSSFIFTDETVIALTGADCQPLLNGKAIDTYRAYHVEKGDELKTGPMGDGIFSYIAFAGGLDIPKVMSSYSTSTRFNIGGYRGRALEEGDHLNFKHTDISFNQIIGRNISTFLESISSGPDNIRVIPSSEQPALTDVIRESFYSQKYTISSKSDRMGYRLEGKRIEMDEQISVISEGTVWGDIQVPPDGQPIILMADRQTTGGYPVIGTVCSVDRSKLVQCSPGTEIQFTQINVEEAQTLFIKQKNWLKLQQERLNDLAFQSKQSGEVSGVQARNKIDDLIDIVKDSSFTQFSYSDKHIKLDIDHESVRVQSKESTNQPEDQ
ncbi:KipI antagonist [Alkalibacterium pelagium]|uniref:Allophanate hydrolase subunit 2 n=1 Tax=Alkalibacterium pelagium TaxID=426702 RepID=A0A1H7P7G1_9LACT|nr:KipI antagonist [Alkalibacterium pelagium]SEL31559.1 Allophanate hydrolase subunit 2 [Alkalibacterium pelagium]